MTRQGQRRSKRDSVRLRIADLAAIQFGVVSRRQAMDLGLSKSAITRLLQSGAWVRLHSGVFRVASSRPSWYQRLQAALLLAGPDAVLSYRSAGAVLRLEGIAAGAVEITVPRRTNYRGIKVHFTQLLQPADVVTIDGFRVTSATRTLLDLAGVVEAEVLETALDDALRRGLTSIPRLRWTLKVNSHRRRGVRLLSQLVMERDPKARPSESIFETRLLRLFKRAGLPLPKTQHEIKVGTSVVARVDFAYPELKLAIEADGLAYHSGRTRFQRDRTRYNQLTSLGWSIIRITWEDLTQRPADIIALIRKMIDRQQFSKA